LFQLLFFYFPRFFHLVNGSFNVTLAFGVNSLFRLFLLKFELLYSLIQSFDIFVECIVTLTRLFGCFFELFALISVLFQHFNEFSFFLQFNLMLLGISFTLLLDFRFLLIDLLVNLYLNVFRGLSFIVELLRHLFGLLIDLFLEFIVLFS